MNILLILLKWPKLDPDRVTDAPWSEVVPCILIKKTLFRTKPLMMYGVMNLLDAFAMASILAAFPVFSEHRFDWDATQLVTFFAFVGIMAPIQFAGTLRLLLRHVSEIAVLKIGYVASATAYVLFFLVGLTTIGWLNFPVAIVVTLGLISNPTQTSLAVREVPRKDIGRLSGAYSVLETSGKLLAPAMVALVLNNTVDGPLPSLVFLVAALILSPGVIMAFTVERFTTVVRKDLTVVLEGTELENQGLKS